MVNWKATVALGIVSFCAPIIFLWIASLFFKHIPLSASVIVGCVTGLTIGIISGVKYPIIRKEGK